MTISHNFHSNKPDSGDTTLVNPSNWNDTHTIALPFAVPTGRTASYVIAASDASTTVKAQADQVCTATVSTGNDATIINAALTTLNALGGTQSLSLVGDFYCTSQINAVSNVNVNLNGTITVNSNGLDNGINYNAITNSTWSDIVVYRIGAPVGTSDIWFMYANATLINNGCDQSLQLLNYKSYNKCTGTLYNCQGIMIMDSSPYIDGFYATGGGDNISGVENCGVMVFCDKGNSDTSQGNKPTLKNGTGVSGYGWLSGGIYVAEESDATVKNCIGYGNTGLVFNGFSTCGIISDNNDMSTFTNCKGYGGDGAAYSHGILAWGCSAATFIGCEGIPGKYNGGSSYSSGWYLTQNATPKLINCTGQSPTLGVKYVYSASGSHQFPDPAPLAAGYEIVMYSMQIYINNSTPGVTLSVGTTPGGSNIASGIDCSLPPGSAPAFGLGRIAIYPGQHIYATPSGGTLPDSSILFYYTIMYSLPYATAITLDTPGNATITNCTFIGSASVDGVVYIKNTTFINWSMTGCSIISIDDPSTYTAIKAASAITNCPIYLSTITGQLSNITSFAAGTAQGSNIQR